MQGQQTSIPALLRSRKPGFTLPADLYCRPDVFNADMDVFFHRHWIFVGLECDVPEPGDIYSVDFGPTSIVLVRGDDEQVRAFYNVCRHRGARIAPPGRDVVGKLVCPYHQWVYDLSGDLVHARDMGDDFDHACHGLRRVNLRNIGGLLFACLSDDAPSDIADLETTMLPRLAPYDLAHAKVAFEADIIEEGNWKLVIENNRECYHCAANHPELCTSFIALDFGYDPAGLEGAERAEADAHEALYTTRMTEWEAQGFPSRAVEHVAGHVTNFRTQRLMMAGPGESQTPDGRAACSRLLGHMTRKDLGDVHLWTHNSWHHFMGDHALSVIVIPLSPDRTLVRTKWLVHQDAVEGVDYDVENLTAVWKATNVQDAELVGLAQQGVSNYGYQPGPYSRFTEQQLDTFMTWYVDRMQANGY